MSGPDALAFIASCHQILLTCIDNGATDFTHQDRIVTHDYDLAAEKKQLPGILADAVLAFTPDLIPNTPKIIIHCVRHAQGPHNLQMTNKERAKVVDPGLTDFGVLQCATLSAAFPRMDKITHIVSSPSRRTILTTKFAFRQVLNRGVEILLLNFLKEKGHCACNMGSPIPTLKEEFKDLKVNFSRLEEGWEVKNLDYHTHGWKALAVEMRKELYLIGKKALEKGEVNADGNIEILVTSHGGTLKTIDGHSRDNASSPNWGNTEHRAYEFFSDERAKKHGISPYEGLRECLHPSFNSMMLKRPLRRQDLIAWGWVESEIERISPYRDSSLIGFRQLRADRKRFKE